MSWRRKKWIAKFAQKIYLEKLRRTGADSLSVIYSVHSATEMADKLEAENSAPWPVKPKDDELGGDTDGEGQ